MTALDRTYTRAFWLLALGLAVIHATFGLPA